LTVPGDGPVTHAALTEAETDELAGTAADAYRMSLDEVVFAAVLDVLDGAAWARCAIERDGRALVDGIPAAAAVGPFTLRGKTIAAIGRRPADRLLAEAKQAYRAAAPTGEPPTVLMRWLAAPPGTDGDAPITITAAVVDGRLRVDWAGHGDADRVVASLRTLAEHCRSAGAGAVSASDFPMAGLDSDELTAVLDGLAGS
ncbi:MAG TPA: hypothetical protein VF892_26200, partial [Pseudonocardiaceae bacterium]